jgi:hypothetical protein
MEALETKSGFLEPDEKVRSLTHASRFLFALKPIAPEDCATRDRFPIDAVSNVEALSPFKCLETESCRYCFHVEVFLPCQSEAPNSATDGMTLFDEHISRCRDQIEKIAKSMLSVAEWEIVSGGIIIRVRCRRWFRPPKSHRRCCTLISWTS